jgi:hypothetical protein
MDPIRAAYNYQTGLRRVGASKYSHILIADIAAFYQYVDHSILRDELDLVMADITLVDALIDTLGDIEGRSFGIPQRSAPSDWISEFYIARLERSIVRDGFDVWRYSDDFRIGCSSYSEALRAIESLSRAARDIGLVLNDQKTAAPSFFTYLIHNLDVEIHDASAQIDPSDVEAAVSSDYAPDDDDQAAAEADQTIARLWDPDDHEGLQGEEQWNLRKLNADQHREVRRALNTLTRCSDERAMPCLLSILAYQPAMTHRVVRYAEALSGQVTGLVQDFFGKAITRLSLNEWQRAWIAYGLRACSVPIDRRSREAIWLLEQLTTRPNSLSASEAAITLSEGGLVDFKTIDDLLRFVSPDFAPWYLHAIAILRPGSKSDSSQIAALRQSSAIAAAILR